MTPSQTIAQMRHDMARHHLEARRAIAKGYVEAVSKRGDPGIPWRTGQANLFEKQSFYAPSHLWPLGMPWKSYNNRSYAGILAGGRRRGRRGMLGSEQNRRGHLITADEAARAAFSRFAWRPTR